MLDFLEEPLDEEVHNKVGILLQSVPDYLEEEMDEQSHNRVRILLLLEKLRVSKTTIMLWRNDAINSQAPQEDGIIKREFSRLPTKLSGLIKLGWLLSYRS